MAVYYHLSVGIIGRGRGQSAVACAAYRSGTALADERYGKVHDYRPRQGIAECGIAAPEGAPEWMGDRERLWNAVEALERRKDAQLSREFVVAFPHQIDADARRALLEEFVAQEFTERGLVADWAIHAPNRAGDERNWHAHVMTTMRAVEEDGFAVRKDRTLNDTARVVEWRAAWADKQTELLERLGIRAEDGSAITIDARSYAAQEIAREPTIHLGVHATAMERAGKPTALGDLNRETAARNAAQDAHPRRARGLTQAEGARVLDAKTEEVRPRRSRIQEARATAPRPETRGGGPAPAP